MDMQGIEANKIAGPETAAAQKAVKFVLFQVCPQKVYRPRSSEGSIKMKLYVDPEALNCAWRAQATQNAQTDLAGERVTMAA